MVNMLQIDNSVGAPNVLGCGGVFWHSGIPGFWHSGIPTFWHSGIPEFCDYPSFFGGGEEFALPFKMKVQLSAETLVNCRLSTQHHI